MRSRVSLLFRFLPVLIFSCVFFIMFPISASAEQVLMTKDQFVSMFGSTIPAHVTVSGGDTYDITLNNFTYDYAPNGWDAVHNPVCNSSGSASAFAYAWYGASIIPNNYGKIAIESMTIDFQCTFSNARWGFFLSDAGTWSDSSNWLLSFSSCAAGNFGWIAADSNSSKIAKANWGLVDRNAKFCPFYADNSTTSIDGITVTHFTTEGQTSVIICFMCPLYDQVFEEGIPVVTTTSETGTTSTTTNTQAINVNVNVDMQPTNNILTTISQGISGIASDILDGLIGLFVPDDDVISDFKDDMDDLLQDHLGGLYQAFDLLVDFFESFSNVTVKDSIYIPACNVPLAGETLTLGNWTVPLKIDNQNFNLIYTGIAWITDFLCTFAFLKMCRNKLEIFLNPDSEVISSDN